MRTVSKAFLAAAVTAVTVALPFAPAHATPDGVAIKVYETSKCSSSYCTTSDPQVADGGAVAGKIQVSAQVDPGLDTSMAWYELEVRAPGSEDWVCVAHKNTSVTSTWLNWTTSSFPSEPAGCASSSLHGAVTVNGEYDLRMTVNDGGGSRRSDVASVYLSNRPATPRWVSSPTVLGNGTKTPRVQLRWYAQSAEGVVEYLVVRGDPDGDEVTFWFNAASPGGQGCSSASSSTTLTCYDDTLSGYGYGGEYVYAIYAYRKTQASASEANVVECHFSSGNCIESQQSDGREVAMSAPVSPTPTPPPSKDPTTTPSATQTPRVLSDRERPTTIPRSSGDRASYCDFFCGEYENELPFDQRGSVLPGAGGGGIYAGSQQAAGPSRGYFPAPRDERAYVLVAGGMLMLLVAAHMARILRHRPA